jgi:hypothetical protein
VRLLLTVSSSILSLSHEGCGQVRTQTSFFSRSCAPGMDSAFCRGAPTASVSVYMQGFPCDSYLCTPLPLQSCAGLPFFVHALGKRKRVKVRVSESFSYIPNIMGSSGQSCRHCDSRCGDAAATASNNDGAVLANNSTKKQYCFQAQDCCCIYNFNDGILLVQGWLGPSAHIATTAVPYQYV